MLKMKKLAIAELERAVADAQVRTARRQDQKWPVAR
jgi:hypothetical protein